MNITAIDTPVEDQLVADVVVPYFENSITLTGSAKKLDTLLNQSISKLIDDKEITGKVSETTSIYTYGTIKAKKILLVGLGTIENCDLETIRTIFGKLTSRFKVKEILHILDLCLKFESNLKNTLQPQISLEAIFMKLVKKIPEVVTTSSKEFNAQAIRPSYSVLDNSKVKQNFILPKVGLKEVLKKDLPLIFSKL